MLKVVVFDSGFGGELFADLLEEELPVIEVVRVIDWRHADQLLKNAKAARLAADEALRPYIGRVDLIVLANHLLSLTSLNYFRQKYGDQKFIGLELKKPDTFIDQTILVLTTSAVSRSLKYHKFVRQLKRRAATLAIDTWPAKIDDGELTLDEIKSTIGRFIVSKGIEPSGLILACAQLEDIKSELEKVFTRRVKIHSSFDAALREVYQSLKLRSSFKRR